jgi:hypothetical protein
LLPECQAPEEWSKILGDIDLVADFVGRPQRLPDIVLQLDSQ